MMVKLDIGRLLAARAHPSSPSSNALALANGDQFIVQSSALDAAEMEAVVFGIRHAGSYLISRRYPNTFLKYVNFPVIFSGKAYIPPASAVNYVNYVLWAIVGFIFQYVIRRRHFSWWTKYNLC
ncbi:hypothetical protein SCHPADRAFT_988863 [Schizopora paradoxa]|uniref:Uncharacterized protein n=1 Tax=Schizopora paradoxa TaxID=27342 RepID=A0A0H2R057_9AGAM|nr:hypothetical protein SCHPADRAFT_988863 [Schizopora paradoxa]